MAHSVEPMDIDNIESDFDNKENSIHHSNVYPRTPCTEKGYEELDVSELNMKLRYSITPASSPMSKSFTANSVDNRGFESGDDNINSNLTRSLHSAITKGDVINKSVKILPLQTISSEQFADINRSVSVLRPLDTTTVVDNNVTITVTEALDADEIMSYPSSSSSTAHTPEATTPTKDIPRSDGGSPIMRGLKSVLNMFRSSQSPIPSADSADGATKQALSPVDVTAITPNSSLQTAPSLVLASTPLATIKNKESNLSRQSSPLKESLVFNDDLEKELLWKEETTILFSQEKIPIHKLVFQQGTPSVKGMAKNTEIDADLNSTVEYMDISFNDSMMKNRTITELHAKEMHANESDAEFLDCETTFTNDKADGNVTDSVDNNVNDFNVTDLIANNVNNESNLTSNVTEIISASNAQNSSIKTVQVTEIMPETKLQQPDVTTSLEKETKYIPQLKSEPETNYNKQEIFIDNKNNLSEIIQEINEVITIVDAKNNGKSESKSLLDATLDTRKLHTEAQDYIVKESQPDIISSKLQVDMTFETCQATDVEIVTSSVSTSALNTTKVSEKSNTNIDNDLAVLNTEIIATLFKETENFSVNLDINDTNVKNEDKINAPIEKQIDILNSPANIPLPDDEDIENEKSIGAVILVEEGTVPFSLDNNNLTVTGLENVDQVENMPIEQAKSIDGNNTFNENLAIKDFVVTNNESKLEQIDPLNVNNVGNDNNVSVQINPIQKKIKSVEFINEPMGINDSISDAQVLDVDLQQNIVNAENIEQNLDITLEHFSDSKDKAIQLEYQTIAQAQTDVLNTDISGINKAKVEDTEINVIVTPHVRDIVDCLITKEETRQIHESEIELKYNISMNNNATLLDNKGPQEQQINVNESPEFQNVLNETAVVSDVIQEKTLTEDAKIKDLAKIEEISVKQLSLENISVVKSTSSPPLSPLPHEKNEIAIIKEKTFLKDQIVVDDVVANVENKDEEIVLSENNSPYVSLGGQIDQVSEHPNFKEMESSCATKSRVVLTPPSSPKIVSKGYNFDFDEIVDPFATKTKIRLSPTPDTPKKALNETDSTFTERPSIRDVNKNRRKSQPDRKKPGMPKKKMNSTFCVSVNVSEATSDIKSEVNKQEPDAIKLQPNVTINNKCIPTESLQENKDDKLELSSPKQIDTTNIASVMTVTSTEIVFQESTSKDIAKEEKSLDVRDIDTTMEVNTEENKSSVESLNAISTETKNASSSEHSTYYSAGTSSGEGAVSRNVFNLPEIDDANFNPFVSKSKIRQSPPPNVNATPVLNASQECICPSDDACKFKADATFTGNPFESKPKMRLSPPPNLNGTTTLNATQDLSYSDVALKSKSDATFSEKIFESKSEMRLSPPLNLNATTTLNDTQELYCSSDATSKSKSDATFTEIQFESKSKMRLSSPPNFNATTTLNTTQDLSCSSDVAAKFKSDGTFAENFYSKSLNQNLTQVNAGDFEINKDIGTFDDKEYANISNTTCSSKATDEKDLTVREVLTEDEDTMEGPFLEAEDLNNDDRMSDFDGEDVDMMQFSELPAQIVEENVDGGELFIDAEAFEFLLNQNKSNVVADSGKESLFLKFDPLFAKRMSSDGVLAALNKKRQSTPKKMSAAVHMDATFDSSIAGPSILNTTNEVATNSTAEESTDDFNVTVSKPMMVVTPAVNPIVTPRNRTATPPSSNRRSITFTSPAIAVIDRLLSLSANNSLVGHDTTVTHMSREQAEADLALMQLRELLAEKEINVYNLRTESKELKDRLSSMESQMRILELESQDRLKKINNLNEKLTEKTKLNKSMAAVVEEYERTIASLIAETEQDKKRNNEERMRLIKERDEQTAHLASMEVSFSDLHSKYEKSKQIILTCKANEDAYKKSIKGFEENLTKMQSNYELLKQHATSKLNHANQELEKMNRSHESEVLKLNAMIKRKDLHITSLEETLAQKTKANEELTAICDELINKVG